MSGEGTDRAVWSSEGNIEEEGIRVGIVPLDEIYGTDSKGIGDIVVVGVPGWSCFENSVR